LDQSETSNSNCSGFNTFAKAASHWLRSALPYLIPFTVQLASALDLGMIRSTITPMKPLHSGSLALTALVIANSSSARVKVRRFVFKNLSESLAMTNGNLIHPPVQRNCADSVSFLDPYFDGNIFSRARQTGSPTGRFRGCR
jgi:hypothetical protein